MVPIFLLPSLGELLGQKSGVYNIGIEGVMAFGAIMGVLGCFFFRNFWCAMIFGFIGGIILGALNSFLSIHLKLNQVIVGFGIWFLGTGLAGLLYMGTPVKGFTTQRLSPIFLSLDIIFYISIIIFIAFHIIFSYTKQGLIIRAVGIDPRAADVAGINIYKVRWVCTTIGAGLVGFGGAYFAVNFFQGFTQVMVSGYGWIAFAIVIVGRWIPWNVLLSSFLFATMSGLQMRFQIAGWILPAQIANVLPHLSMIVALSLIMAFGGRLFVPESLGSPYERE
jgi:simple sugar transport system permease protein